MCNFYAYLGRMKYIQRWSLMRNTYQENIMQHSCETAQISFGLATIAKNIYGINVDIYKVTTQALFHEISEVLTGDLPTPIKYFDKDIKEAYKKIEAKAEEKIISELPTELQNEFNSIHNIDKNSREYKIVKAADKLSAYIKCIEELKAGNNEFLSANKSIKKDIENIAKEQPEVKYFIDNFIESYKLTLDELNITIS